MLRQKNTVRNYVHLCLKSHVLQKRCVCQCLPLLPYLSRYAWHVLFVSTLVVVVLYEVKFQTLSWLCFFSESIFSLFPRPNHIAVSSVISCSCVKSSFFREKIELSPKIDLHSSSVAQQPHFSLLLHTHHTTYSLRKIHATWLLFKPSTFFIFRFLIQSPSLVCCKAAIPPALLHEQLQFSPNYPRPFKLETLFDRGKNCSYTL